MILTLDNLAYRYHCLPSEALARSTTFDLYVLDISSKWNKHRQDVADGKAPDHTIPPPLTQEQMQAMIDRVRSEND